MSAWAETKKEWRQFKDDHPGHRFEHHRHRMDAHPTWHKVARAIAGVTLVGVGIVFCFLPGPGVLGIAFGLALLAGMSRTIAHLMDRIEPRFRRGLERVRSFWQELSAARRAALISLATVVVAMGVIVVWRGWVGPVVTSYLADLR